MTSFDWSGIIASVPTALVAIVAIVYSNIGNKRLQNTSILLDFSKRYQDLMTAMPEGPEFSEKYACLYFDLCSEEYRLHSLDPKMIGDYIWKLWEEGMTLTIDNHSELSPIWQKHRDDYATTHPGEKESFQAFFDRKIPTQ